VVPEDSANDQALVHAQIRKPSFYLLRPDGHIGLVGAELDIPAMANYLGESVKLRMAIAAGTRRDEVAAHGPT
jgi:hypothetical protein